MSQRRSLPGEGSVATQGDLAMVVTACTISESEPWAICGIPWYSLLHNNEEYEYTACSDKIPGLKTQAELVKLADIFIRFHSLCWQTELANLTENKTI